MYVNRADFDPEMLFQGVHGGFASVDYASLAIRLGTIIAGGGSDASKAEAVLDALVSAAAASDGKIREAFEVGVTADCATVLGILGITDATAISTLCTVFGGFWTRVQKYLGAKLWEQQRVEADARWASATRQVRLPDEGGGIITTIDGQTSLFCVHNTNPSAPILVRAPSDRCPNCYGGNPCSSSDPYYSAGSGALPMTVATQQVSTDPKVTAAMAEQARAARTAAEAAAAAEAALIRQQRAGGGGGGEDLLEKTDGKEPWYMNKTLWIVGGLIVVGGVVYVATK